MNAQIDERNAALGYEIRPEALGPPGYAGHRAYFLMPDGTVRKGPSGTPRSIRRKMTAWYPGVKETAGSHRSVGRRAS